MRGLQQVSVKANIGAVFTVQLYFQDTDVLIGMKQRTVERAMFQNNSGSYFYYFPFGIYHRSRIRLGKACIKNQDGKKEKDGSQSWAAFQVFHDFDK
jgi:hypothetical protein